MFTTYKNHEEANSVLKIFKPLVNYHQYTDDHYSAFSSYFSTKYIANLDNEWQLITHFYGKKEGKSARKQYAPIVQFQKDTKAKMTQYTPTSNQERLTLSQTIAEFLQNTYKPDFDRVLKVIEYFIEEGINSGLFNHVDIRKYKKNMSAHMHINHYHGIISLWNQNHSNITFNNVLQKGSGRTGKHFKKSFLSVDVVFLANSKSEVELYFKIKLPKSSTSKIILLIPLSGGNKIYQVTNDDSLIYNPIDKIVGMPINQKTLSNLFKDTLQDEIKKSISKTLKIKKTELDKLSADELKDYFVLVEMVKI